MKKLFLFLALFLTSILFVSNVKAAGQLGNIKIDKSFFESIHSIYDLDISNKTSLSIDEIVERLKQQINYDQSNEEFLIRYNIYGSIYIYTWKKTQAFDNSLGFYFNKNYNKVNIGFGIETLNSQNVMYYAQYDISSNKFFGPWLTSSFYDNFTSGTISNGIVNSKNWGNFYYSSSVNIVLNEIEYNNNSHYTEITVVENEKNLKTFKVNDVIFTKDNKLNIESPKPQITFNEIEKKYEDNSNKNMIYHKISINFSIFDIDKYNYLYKTSIDNEWHVITCNDLEYTSYKNQTLYVAVIDRKKYELSGEYDYISTATYTFANVVGYRPTVDYKIEIDKNEYVNNQKKLYNITLTYKNMTDEYYSTYYNLKDGTTKYIGTGKDLTSYKINYVNDDAIITIYIYTNDNEMIYYTTIDLENIDLDLTKPYIFIMGYNQKNLPNSVAYQYKNANDTDNKCFYKFGGGELTQESCSSDEIKFRNSSYNTSLSLMIYDNNNKILATKTVNLNFITGYPRLEFETYYSSFVKGQILNVKLLDYQENDTLFYSTDNANWNQLATQESNSLTFFENTPIYFKIYRNNEVIADSYYYVKIGNYSISISEDNTIDEIKKLTGSSMGTITSFLESIKENTNTISELIKYFYNGLDSNIKAFLIATFTLIIVCSIIILARK